MNSKIIYTTIFGGYDDITKPTLPNNWDWKCFSEENSIPLYTDNTRNAKKFKVLPRVFLITLLIAFILLSFQSLTIVNSQQ